MVKISKIETYSLLIPDFDSDACSSAQDNFVVKIYADNGLYGIGESDTNPWKSTTIEWTETTSPPLGHGNFEKIPVVFRGPYEYSVEGSDEDYCPQTEE